MELQVDPSQLVQQPHKKHKRKEIESATLQENEGYLSITFFLGCFKEITYKSIPRILNYEFNLMTMSLINIYLLGQKGNLLDIKIFGLGDVFARIFAYSLIKYKNMALQQECTVALSAKNYTIVGVYYQRSLLIVGIICILSSPFLCFWWKIMQFIGIDHAIAKKAGDYMWVCLPSIFCFGYYDTTNNYLQSQNVLFPQIENNMGVIGAAWAKNFSDFSSAALIYAFITFRNPTPKTWIEWDSRAFVGIKRYLQQSIRNGIGQYLEEVAFLSLTMMAMYLSDPESTATHIALQNSGLFHFSFFLGIHFVIQNFVGSSVSKGHLDRAKRRAFMSIITSFIFIGLALFILLNNKSQWSEQFSTNKNIQTNLQNCIVLYTKIVAFDGLQLTFCAIMKSIDRFNQITIIYSVSYYLLGLGTSIYYGFYKGLGETGIWRGWLYAAGFSSILFVLVIISTSWYEQYKSIKIRYNKDIIITNYQKTV